MGPAEWSSAHPRGRALRLGLVAAALGAALLFDVPLCPFAIITRHPCPGCGLTRATLALVHGDLHRALVLHPLSILVSPIVIGAMIYNGISYIRRGRWAAAEAAQGRVITALGIALGVAMIFVWIARFFGAFGGAVPV